MPEHTENDPRDVHPTRDGGVGSDTFDSDQLQPEDTLVGSLEGDPLDSGYTPPERLQHATGHGTTPAEQREDESIDQRIAQEEPDPDSAYGAPDDEGGLEDPAMAGGDDPDAIPASRDVLGDDPALRGAEGETGVAELVAPEAGVARDATKDLVADEAADVDVDTAEEAAMHITDPDRS